MILIYIVFLIFAAVVFFFTPRLGLSTRLLIAAIVFLLPSLVMTVWVIKVGDKPLPGARTIHLAPNDEDQRSEKQ